jgi:hypothetical protein
LTGAAPRTSNRILADTGFRRFMAPPLQAYPAVEDYLGFDHATGRLVHLHLHYQLTLGQRHLKGYRLPWESQLLGTRHFDTRYGLSLCCQSGARIAVASGARRPEAPPPRPAAAEIKG